MRLSPRLPSALVLGSVLAAAAPVRAQDEGGNGKPAPSDKAAAAQPASQAEAAKPPETQPAPTSATAATSATAGASADADGASVTLPEDKGGVALSLGAYLGGGLRLDDPPAYESQGRGGVMFGGTAAIWPTSWLGVAVSFEHLDLGTDRASDSQATFDVDRDLNTLWGSLRLAPWRTGVVPYLTIGAGLAWQSLEALGTAYPFPQGSAPIPLRCEGSASASLALRAGAGIEGRLEKGLVFFAEGGPDMIRLDDAPLDGCAAGAGTVMELALRAGAQYRFDVTHSVR